MPTGIAELDKRRAARTDVDNAPADGSGNRDDHGAPTTAAHEAARAVHREQLKEIPESNEHAYDEDEESEDKAKPAKKILTAAGPLADAIAAHGAGQGPLVKATHRDAIDGTFVEGPRVIGNPHEVQVVDLTADGAGEAFARSLTRGPLTDGREAMSPQSRPPHQPPGGAA